MPDPAILFLDDHFVAVNKPSGLLVHRSDIDRHETRFALQLVRDRLGRHVFPVHRLDRPTSGVLLFAFSGEAARRAAEALESAEAAKTYLAVVRGIAEEESCIDYPLHDIRDRFELPREPSGEGRPAVTDFRRLAAVELPFAVGPHPSARYSLLEVQLRTGRRHQIRRHLKHLFHPAPTTSSSAASRRRLSSRPRTATRKNRPFSPTKFEQSRMMMRRRSNSSRSCAADKPCRTSTSR